MTHKPTTQVPRELADALSAWAAGADDVTSPLAIAVAKHLRRALFTSPPAQAGCSCMEVYGEDPRCIKHGEGTKWRKQNPDICELAEKAAQVSGLQQRIGELEQDYADAREYVTSLVLQHEAAEQQIARDRIALEDAGDSLSQLLDDMGERGLCVCQAAKEEAQAALATVRQALQEPQP